MDNKIEAEELTISKTGKIKIISVDYTPDPYIFSRTGGYTGIRYLVKDKQKAIKKLYKHLHSEYMQAAKEAEKRLKSIEKLKNLKQ